jgi:hypothetical protein
MTRRTIGNALRMLLLTVSCGGAPLEETEPPPVGANGVHAETCVLDADDISGQAVVIGASASDAACADVASALDGCTLSVARGEVAAGIPLHLTDVRVSGADVCRYDVRAFVDIEVADAGCTVRANLSIGLVR